MQTRTHIHAHEDLWGCCCSPLISLNLLGACHMLWVRWGRGWAFGQYPPFLRAGRWMRRGTRHFQEVFHQRGPIQSSCLQPHVHWHTACPLCAEKHHQIDICWWECPRNNFFRGLLIWQRSIIFQKMAQKSPAWSWRADMASGSGGHGSLPGWNSLKILLLRRCEGQTIKTQPAACQSVSENGAVLDLCVKPLPFVNASFKAMCNPAFTKYSHSWCCEHHGGDLITIT